MNMDKKYRKFRTIRHIVFASVIIIIMVAVGMEIYQGFSMSRGSNKKDTSPVESLDVYLKIHSAMPNMPSKPMRIMSSTASNDGFGSFILYYRVDLYSHYEDNEIIVDSVKFVNNEK